MSVAAVLLDVAVGKVLDYSIPENLIGKVSAGSIVKVPLQNRVKHGTVLELKEKSEFPAIKPLIGLINDSSLPEDLLKLSLWISEHYCTPWETVLKSIIPSSIRGKARPKEQFFVTRQKTIDELRASCIQLRQKSPKQSDILEIMLSVEKGIALTELLAKETSKSALQSLLKKGLLKLEKMFVDRSPLKDADFFPTKAKKLSDEQAQALANIQESIDQNQFAAHLLWGITGSGKTEVYLQAIDHALQHGKSTIMLVPEISLTSQTIERFKSRFTTRIAILHCRLSQGERFDEWMKICRGEASIVIGARSSIFSPVKNLGLIIVDEEHDMSYKQSEQMPSYQARDVAVMRGSLAKAAVVLGSATPSLETFYNCEKGKYKLSILKNRALQAELPEVEIIDMRHEWDKAKGFTLFSEKLLSSIQKNISNGEQTILFLNRRGYHTSLLCPSCGDAVKCISCDVAMTYHYREDQLACHLCGYSQKPPKTCPKCSTGAPMKFKGVGTEQVERALHAIFPEVRTSRLDKDTTKHKGSHQRIFKEFKTGKADILIGTQMVAKGLHFPEVTLVGVLNCDSSLSIPDFRASETTFQLITQVAGRSGRGALKGKVILQTLMPANSTILHASHQDYEGFYKEELESRKAFDYPPFSQLIKLRLSGKEEKKTHHSLEAFRKEVIAQLPSQYEISPVIPSGHAKVKDAYRFQFLIRGPKIAPLVKTLSQLSKKHAKIFIDVNPTSTFF